MSDDDSGCAGLGMIIGAVVFTAIGASKGYGCCGLLIGAILGAILGVIVGGCMGATSD